MKVTPKQFWKSIPAAEKQRIASECETSVNYIRHVFHQRRPAGWDLCKKIEKATAGKIPCSMLRPDIFGDTAA